MKYKIIADKHIERIIGKWKKSNPNLFKKFISVINDIAVHPRTGIGHPEALVGCQDITYSRHIDAHNRIIYDIHDDVIEVLLLKVEGHYNDK